MEEENEGVREGEKEGRQRGRAGRGLRPCECGDQPTKTGIHG